MSLDAAASWFAGTTNPMTCPDPGGGTDSCTSEQGLGPQVDPLANGPCAVWCYTGELAGYVVLSSTGGPDGGGAGCICPTLGSNTWN
jgi:hypothetical protein